VQLANGANALDTRKRYGHHRQAEAGVPARPESGLPFDTTPFVRASIEEVVKTLFEAIGLVFLVMLLFLQSIRATFIRPLRCRWCCSARLGSCRPRLFDQYTDHVRHGTGIVCWSTMPSWWSRMSSGSCRERRTVAARREPASRWSRSAAPCGYRLVLLGRVPADGVLRRSTGVIYRQFSLTWCRP